MALRTGSTLSQEEWQKFFSGIGIAEKSSKKYAATFHEHEVQQDLLKYITDDELQDTYLVQLGGHRLAIRHSLDQQPHSSQEGTSSSSSNSFTKPHIRHKPPQLQPQMNPSSFRAFSSHWEVYKRLVGIRDNSRDAAMQIFSLACVDSPEIRQTIADHNPNHLCLSEMDYLDMIRRLVTSHATPETYRTKFFNMVQTSGESCQQWLKRLREVTPDCEFVIPCDNKNGSFHRFDENLLRSKFIVGLYNSNIKQDLLTKSQELTTLSGVFNHACRMEATARDIHSSVGIAEIVVHDDESSNSEDEFNRISTYRKQKKPSQPSQTSRRKYKQCSGCGSSLHGDAERPTRCPAWKKSCNNCGKKGHFSKVCRSEKPTDCANAVIASVKDSMDRNNEIKMLITPL